MEKATNSPAVGAAPPPTTRPPRQLLVLTALLERPGGASMNELMIATGWEAAWVRGAIFGALKKTRGLSVMSERTRGGRIYRIGAPGPARRAFSAKAHRSYG
jgi:hypothetical protein